MTRHDVITRLLGLFKTPAYLEVGVNKGETFHRVTAARKVAVDPRFLFDAAARGHAGTEYHEVPSDVFFSGQSGPVGRFDVIFLDGLHTFEQTLRDLLNATSVLRPGGVIVIDDVLPNSFDASLPDYRQVERLRSTAPAIGTGWTSDGSWMGDVFKLVFFIETFMQHYAFATVAENHGQTVLWEQVRPAPALPHRTMEEISRLDYRDTILRRAVFRIMPLGAIVEEIGRARAAPGPAAAPAR